MGAVGEVIAFRFKHKGTKVHQGRWWTTAEDRALRLEFQRGVAARSCCVAAYMVEAVTLSPKIALEAGLPRSCPVRCPDWAAFDRAGRADQGLLPGQPVPWRGGRT
jgi:hypothetical protein